MRWRRQPKVGQLDIHPELGPSVIYAGRSGDLVAELDFRFLVDACALLRLVMGVTRPEVWATFLG